MNADLFDSAITNHESPITPAAPAVGCGMSDDELAVYDAIRVREGMDSAIPMEELAAAVGRSTRAVQEMVAHLIGCHSAKIGSATGKQHGYYWITDAEDLARAKAQLTHRIVELAKRLRALDRNALAEVMGQIELTMRAEG